VSETKSGGLFDQLKDSKAKTIAAAAYPLIALGIAWAGVTNALDDHEQDIRELKAQAPAVYRLTADMSYLKERVTELRDVEEEHYQDLRSTLNEIQRQIYARGASPTAMPAAAMGPHAQLKAME